MTPRNFVKTAFGASILLASSAILAAAPIDDRTTIAADSWKQMENGEWLSPVETPEFPFDELIYSWDIKIPEGEGFRLSFQVNFNEADSSPWLYAGYWGVVTNPTADRQNPEFEYGKVLMDQLLLQQKKAKSFQFRISSSGTTTLTTLPKMTVITTDNEPTDEMYEKYQPVATMVSAQGIVMDLPLRLQCDSQGEFIADKCQSAAVATAMEYFGKEVPLEDIIKWTHDPEYDYPGIWPRTLGVASQNGFEVYIDRFRNWQQVESTVASGKVILCSTKTKGAGPYKAAPYDNWGGHIVALNGFTEDGMVVITDSALKEDQEGYLCQWYKEDFEKAWMDSKGGVGMVIVPPEGFEMKTVEEMPPFDLADRFARAAARKKASGEEESNKPETPTPQPTLPPNFNPKKGIGPKPGEPGGMIPL